MIAGLEGGNKEWLEGFRYPLVAGVVAAIGTVIATPVVRRIAIKHGAVDDPTRDSRRVHTEPIPRWGGIGIYFGILVAVLAVLPFAYPYQPFPPYLWALLGLGAVLVAYGAADDVKNFSAKIQLLVLFGVGIGVQFIYNGMGRVQISGLGWPPLFGTGWLDFGVWSVVITAFYIFVVTKTMDTIDGVDGLAAGIAGIAAGALTVVAKYEGQPRVALVCAAIAGACIGFLRYNYNPARIFMGTGGAQLLGFLLACLSAVGALKTAAALALFIPVLVFGVPLVDALTVTIRRILAGQPISQADKRHLHHQLLAKGLSQRQTVWVLYCLAIALSGLMIFMVARSG